LVEWNVHIAPGRIVVRTECAGNSRWGLVSDPPSTMMSTGVEVRGECDRPRRPAPFIPDEPDACSPTASTPANGDAIATGILPAGRGLCAERLYQPTVAGVMQLGRGDRFMCTNVTLPLTHSSRRVRVPSGHGDKAQPMAGADRRKNGHD